MGSGSAPHSLAGPLACFQPLKLDRSALWYCRGILDGLQWSERLWVFPFVCKHVGLHAHECVWFSRHSTFFSEIGSLIQPDWLASELRDPPVFAHWGYRHEVIQPQALMLLW